MARLISCPLAFRFAFCFFTALLTLARELAMLGSWNKLLVSDTFCSSNARNWSHCGQYVNTTLHMIPERSIHTSTNQVFLIQLLLLSRTIWSGILLEEETYQVWRTQATPSVPCDKDMHRHHVQYRTIRWKSTRQNSLRHKTSTDSKPANE